MGRNSGRVPGLEEVVRRYASLLIFLVLSHAGVVAAADQPDTTSRIDQVVAEYSAADHPGAAVSVIRDGEVVFSSAQPPGPLQQVSHLSQVSFLLYEITRGRSKRKFPYYRRVARRSEILVNC